MPARSKADPSLLPSDSSFGTQERIGVGGPGLLAAAWGTFEDTNAALATNLFRSWRFIDSRSIDARAAYATGSGNGVCPANMGLFAKIAFRFSSSQRIAPP